MMKNLAIQDLNFFEKVVSLSDVIIGGGSKFKLSKMKIIPIDKISFFTPLSLSDDSVKISAFSLAGFNGGYSRNENHQYSTITTYTYTEDG